ncbi:hypothetical protein LTR10_001626 [Elasticomyces elasticus]|nr:hypothetical protein LTR10_001626 [Elasticomyces elasticus]KAK4975129.1 hypothetical protein LTR42_004339 [Elasticomyces elasticus]
MYMPNNATALADYPSTTITVLTETAMFVIDLSKYLILISAGLAISLASSLYTARAMIYLSKSRQTRQLVTSKESSILAEAQREVDIKAPVLIITVVGYISALGASFVNHCDDGEHWPGVFVITSGCVIGVLVGHLLCVLITGLFSGALAISRLQLGWNRDVPEVRKGRRISTADAMRKYDV